MNNKNKREIWDELQLYKKQVEQYENFWYVTIIGEHEKKIRKLRKTLEIFVFISLLTISFLLGLNWR